MRGTSDGQTVLVVDDTPENITILASTLSEYNVKAARSGAKAIAIARSAMPDIILLDIMMPGMDGYTTCKLLKGDPRTRNIPVIFITAMNDVSNEAKGFALGAVDYITKPISPPIVQARVRTHLQLYDQNRALETRVAQRTRELNESRLEIIHRLGLAAEFRDNETGMHVVRISKYCRLLARAIGLDDIEVELLQQASPMHDVGKIGVPDKVLLKPGKLDAEERALMEKHCEIGAKIIGEQAIPLFQTARTVALTHHERWDGSGYPRGLAGEQIPMEGRIVAIADVFDALISERPYKQAWPLDQAVQFIQENAGLHFDPMLVEVFMDHLDEIITLAKNYADDM